MTVGELKKALRDVADGLPVHVMFDPDTAAREENAHAYETSRAEYAPACSIANPAFLVMAEKGFWY